MKKVRKLAGLLLALVMVLSLNITALTDTPITGTITITNATIGQSYHIFKLFDATVSSEGVNYIATSSQKTALEAVDDNVFAFVQITEDTYSVTYEDEGQYVTETVTESEMAYLTESGVTFTDGPVLVEEGTYYVTVGTDSSTGTTFTDEKVIAFISSYVSRLSSTMMMCNFPGAEEEYATKTNSIDEETVAVAVAGLDDDRLATQSTVTFSGLPLGYYFITSSLGATVSLNTTRTSVSVVDKNTGTPTWDNDPADPDDPVKAVLDTAGRDINEEEVAVGDTLTYQISYTNESGETLTDVTLIDTIPEYSTYVDNSIGISFLDENGETIDLSNYGSAGIGTVTKTYDDTTEKLTWLIAALPDNYTLVATFQVTVDDITTSVTIEIENDADLTVTLGENTYDLKTNKVENPVYPGPKPEKDVYAAETKDYVTGTDIDGNKVKVGDILTYQITYTNEEDDAVELIIKDAPPTGTVFVAGSAKGTVQLAGSTEKTDITEDTENSIEIDTDGTITWTISSLAVGATVEVSFQVEVTEAAITIVDGTIENSAEGTIDGNKYETNTVKNPTGDTPDPGDNGKVIVNADGSKSTVSTGSFGDTVTFDVSIDAVNTVESSDANSTATTTQVTAYYIYDLLGVGFDLDDITKNGYLTIGDTKYSLSYTGDAVSVAKCYQFLDSSDDEVGTLFTYANTDGTTLIAVTIPWVDDSGSALYSNCEVHLIYTATINTDAEIGDNGNQNKAIFDYSTAEDSDPTEPEPDDPKYPSGSDLNHGSEEKETKTYTYALAVQKISQESGVALEGATFTLVDAAGYSIYAVPVKDADDNVVYYNYTSDSTVTDATNEFTTNSDGQIIIKGVDIGTYSFTETKAPSGYTLLGGSVSVTARMNSSSTTKTHTSSTVTRYFEAVEDDEWADVENVYTKGTDSSGNETFMLADKPNSHTTGYYKLVSSSSSNTEEGSLTVTDSFDVEVIALYVENSSGSLLPSTGGIGTTIFYIVGGLLVFGAAVVLITRRRMNAR